MRCVCLGLHQQGFIVGGEEICSGGIIKIN